MLAQLSTYVVIPAALLAMVACSPKPPSGGGSCMPDTTPPELTVTGPSCLWPPNHEWGLYTLGDGIDATVTDNCDSQPVIKIVSVTSNQPDLGGGQGNFAPDIIHGNNAVCFRSERQGTMSTDRLYTIVVSATDSSNNTSTQTLTVHVPHDGTCGGESVPTMVKDGDPRCTQ